MPSYRSARPLACSPISEWSAYDSESSPTSSKPVFAQALRTISPMRGGDRSRTGRVIMPGLAEAAAARQPRKISTDSRSCTVSASGTSGCFG